MFKVKAKRLFKLQPNDRLFKAGQEVELAEHEVKAVQEQLGHDFIEIIEEAKDEDEVVYSKLNKDEIEKILVEQEIDFDEKGTKADWIKLLEKE